MTLQVMSNHVPHFSGVVFGINHLMTSNLAAFITLSIIAIAAVIVITFYLLNSAIPRRDAGEEAPKWVVGRSFPIILLAIRILLPIVWVVWITALFLAFSAMLSPA